MVVNRWSAVTVDCLDLERVATFWSSLLELPPGPTDPGWVYLGTRGEAQPRLVFQPVWMISVTGRSSSSAKSTPTVSTCSPHSSTMSFASG